MKKIKLSLKNKKIIIAACAVISAVVAVVLIITLTGRIRAVDTVKLGTITKHSDINLIGHRGLSAQAPENTLPAFELAAEKGLKAVEFDIQPTKDGVWVLSHDTDINRMTDGRGDISDYTYFDLADYSIDNGANYKKYDNLKMPSLDSALDCCLENGLAPMIEIKDYTDKSIRTLVDSIVTHGYVGSCWVISFNHEALEAVREVNPEIKLVYLVSKLDDEHLDKCLEFPDMGVSFKSDKKHNTPDKIKKLLKNDIELFCWVVDEKEELDFYYDSGIRSFVTNRIIP